MSLPPRQWGKGEATARPDRPLIHGYWIANPPATESDIEKLQAVIRFDLPPEYLDLLRESNGGEGPLALAPLWLQLWTVDEVVEFARWKLPAWRFPGHFFFAGNGAGESIAMRRVNDGQIEIVMIDTLMGAESTQVIAGSFAEFLRAIGK